MKTYFPKETSSASKHFLHLLKSKYLPAAILFALIPFLSMPRIYVYVPHKCASKNYLYI